MFFGDSIYLIQTLSTLVSHKTTKMILLVMYLSIAFSFILNLIRYMYVGCINKPGYNCRTSPVEKCFLSIVFSFKAKKYSSTGDVSSYIQA